MKNKNLLLKNFLHQKIKLEEIDFGNSKQYTLTIDYTSYFVRINSRKQPKTLNFQGIPTSNPEKLKNKVISMITSF